MKYKKIITKLENYLELPSIQGIYFIINTINQKYYLGRAVNIRERYRYSSLEYSHHNEHLKRSILKYGRENFIIEVTEYPNITEAELIEIEQGLLDIHVGLPLCYNMSKFATGGNEAGENHPNYGKRRYNNGIENRYFFPDEEIPEGYFLGIMEETRKKLSEAKKGKNNPNYKKKIYNNGFNEKSFSSQEKIPENFKIGRLLHVSQKISENTLGKKRSEVARQNISKAQKGRKISEETRKKQSKAMKGRKQSKEHILHNSETKKIRVITTSCCYLSVTDALIELGISKPKFLKLFEKDTHTKFYIEKTHKV